MKDEYLTVKEAAQFLKLTTSYLYKLMHWHAIPYYKPFGNRCLFRKDELREYIERGRVGAGAGGIDDEALDL